MPAYKLYIFNKTLTGIFLIREGISSVPSIPQVEIEGDDFRQGVLDIASKWINTKSFRIFTAEIYFDLQINLGVIVDSDKIISQETAEWQFINKGNVQFLPNNDIITLTKFHNIAVKKKKLSSLLTIQNSMKKSRDFLISSCNILEGEWGWDHNLDVKKRIGIIGTALGLITLSYFFPYSTMDIFYKASETLVKKQNPLGGWGTRSMSDGDVPIVHSTAYAIMALSSLGNQEFKNFIEKGGKWLIRAQKNGAWGIDAQSEMQLITPTTLAIGALSKIDKLDDKIVKSTINWLENAQNPDGGWGCYPYNQKLGGQKSTTSHTSRSISSLIELGVSPQEKIISDGVNWLLKSQIKEFFWEHSAESEYVSDQSQRLEFKHAGHQQALIALQKCGYSPENLQVLNGLFHLISMQDDKGGWPHELAPGHMPMWATHDSVAALSLATENLVDVFSPQLFTVDILVLQPAHAMSKHKKESQQESVKNNLTQIKILWITGSLFVLIMMSLIGVAVYASKFISLSGLSMVLTFGVLSFILIIISMLRQTNQIHEKSFKEIVNIILKAISFSRTKK